MVDAFRRMTKDKMTKEECEINERLWGDPYFQFERNHGEIRKYIPGYTVKISVQR